MSKLFRISDYVLIAAAFGADLISETRSGWGIMPSAMENKYGFVPSRWKRTSYLSTVSRMLSVGDVRKVVNKKGRVFLELTGSGEGKFKRRFPIFSQNKKWYGYFMVVSYDIPEVDSVIRRGLRLKLEELGFGMMQKSVWISPYHFEEDLREFLSEHNLEDDVLVLSAKKLMLGNLKAFAKRVWKLEKINNGYFGVMKLAAEVRKTQVRRNRRTIKKIHQLYFETLNTDPMLPSEFLPNNWARNEAVKVLNLLLLIA